MVDLRTLQRALDGLPIKDLCRVRIERALAERHLVHWLSASPIRPGGTAK